jgi:glycosyltransferase involved in cell wall biosynthesis
MIVAGDFTPLGGMDAANHALARYLAARGTIHLVTHRAWPDLTALPSVTVHQVWRPFNRHLLGSPFLSRAGERVWRNVRASGTRAIVNGGNCRLPDINWVHYLHAADELGDGASVAPSAKAALTRRRDLNAERRALQSARLIICNSDRTRDDVVGRIGVDASRVRVVYYGTDPVRFSFVDSDERAAAKAAVGPSTGRLLAGFVGALGDRRKAFDTVFAAWTGLCGRRDWDVDLIVVGDGAERPAWEQRARAAGLGERIRFAGFRTDVPDILAATDVLVHPARYEAYGLSVHEALCRGVPAIVSRTAGVAERYPRELQDLLVTDPNDPEELRTKLLNWRRDLDALRPRIATLSDQLRRHTWDLMAEQIAACSAEVA